MDEYIKAFQEQVSFERKTFSNMAFLPCFLVSAHGVACRGVQKHSNFFLLLLLSSCDLTLLL